MNTSKTPSVLSSSMPRRDFLKTSAGLVMGAALGSSGVLGAAERKRSIGANDRIRIGIIGCGNRGLNTHMESIYKHVGETNFEIVAVCDPWRLARERANAKVKGWFGRDAIQCVSYRELLALDGIDAVMIASPDHHHTTQLEAAAHAGKHIYVEKPLGNEMHKLVRAVDAVKEAGAVVQVGTQIRSYPGVVGARNLFQSGLLGKASRIEECRNREKPYWYQYLGRDVMEQDVDWREFLGDHPMRRFNADMYEAWYGYYEFSRGPVTQWGVHFIDTIHFITGATFPESCVSLGDTFTWKDEHKFTAPDSVQTTWIYPEGFMVSSSSNLGNSSGSSRRIFAGKGVLKLEDLNAPSYSAEGGPRRDGLIRGENEVTPVERPDHFLDWLQCMRTGKTPHASIDAGFQSTVACLMAVQSFETGRRTKYDHDKRAILTA